MSQQGNNPNRQPGAGQPGGAGQSRNPSQQPGGQQRPSQNPGQKPQDPNRR